jgi:hypothetical protein
MILAFFISQYQFKIVIKILLSIMKTHLGIFQFYLIFNLEFIIQNFILLWSL